jgi:8-oxo-dGTP pyrophosphatase MutT (NUDIX family)
VTWDGQAIADDPPTGTVIAVCRRHGDRVEWLVLHRAHRGPEYDGDWAWGSPSGCRLPGEAVEACAHRELLEETGLNLDPALLLDDEQWPVFLHQVLGDLRGRNRRSVWTIATQPYRGAHFATFPERLVETCILAGTSQAGCCPSCGQPWRRKVEIICSNPGNRRTNGPRSRERRQETPGFLVRLERRVSTTGWEPGCGCGTAPASAVVLDPSN